MEVYKILKRDLVDFFEPQAPVSEIFSWLESDFLTQNKLVCQFIINGQELSEVDEIDWAAKPLEMINEIQVRVQGEDSLVCDVIEAWLEALPEIMSFIEKIAAQNSHGSKTFKTRDLMNLVHQQETFVSSLISLKGPLKLMGFEMTEWALAEKTLHDSVLQCVKHLEAKNFVQLIETLEYDGAHALEKWRQILLEMKEKIVQRQSQRDTQNESLLQPTSRTGS
jgi:hypothetical protein